jgi:dipeptidase E
MKLLLTSSGITNKSIAGALRELLGKPFEKSAITFIPTAANVEEGDKTWLVEDMNNIRKLGFKSFDVVDISVVPTNTWFPIFEKSDILVFGGGNTNYLLTWLNKSGVAKVLPRLLKTKVYMGISAGSMVAAKTVSLSKEGILYYETVGSFEDSKGLGFVDFEIRPHLNSPDFPKVRLNFLEKIAIETPVTFYALDDTSAVKVDGNKVSVVSEGKWKKFH